MLNTIASPIQKLKCSSDFFVDINLPPKLKIDKDYYGNYNNINIALHQVINIVFNRYILLINSYLILHMICKIIDLL